MAQIIPEHEIGILTEALPKFGLCAGDSGVIVDVLGDGAAYLVEFFTPEGDTIDVVYVESGQIRPTTPEEDEANRRPPPTFLIPDGGRAELTADQPEHGLRAGEVGVVLHNHQNGFGYALEFERSNGSRIKTFFVPYEELRPVTHTDTEVVTQPVSATK